MNSLEKTKFESAPCHGEDLLLSAKRNLMRGLLLLLLGTHVEADLRSRGHGAQKGLYCSVQKKNWDFVMHIFFNVLRSGVSLEIIDILYLKTIFL